MSQTDRVGLYLRMSDDKQEGSIERQRAGILPYCDRKNYVIVREYVDEGIPGDRMDRPDFQRLLADAGRGLFSRIVVDEPSRLSRSDPLTFLAEVARPLRDARVTVDSVSDGEQDWTDLASLILATVRADRSAGEVRTLSRRVLGGCLRALGAGGLPGGVPPYGYVKQDARWEPDPIRADAVRYAFVRYDRGGIPLQELADELTARGYPPPERKQAKRARRARAKRTSQPAAEKRTLVWTWTGVRRILKNPQYTGSVVWGRRSQGKYTRLAGGPGRADGGRPSEKAAQEGWFVRPGSHEALVSEEVFNRVQRRLSDHHRGGRGPRNLGAYLLSGLCRCGHCGRQLAGVSMKGKRFYRCHPVDKDGRQVCGWRAVEEGKLLERVIGALEAALLDEATWEAALEKAREELRRQAAPGRTESIRGRIEDLEGKIAAGNRRLLQLPDDRLPGAVEALRELEGELAGLRQLEARVTKEGPVRDVEEDLAACREWVGALTQAVDRLDNSEVAGALRGLLTAGVRAVEVNWRTEPFGRKKNRYIPTSGVVELHGPNWQALRQLHAW